MKMKVPMVGKRNSSVPGVNDLDPLTRSDHYKVMHTKQTCSFSFLMKL